MFGIKRCLPHVVMVVSVFYLLSGCTSNVIDIHSKDSSTFVTLETSLPVSKDDAIRVKFRTSQVDGSFTQTIPGGKMIVIDGEQIHGEADIAGATKLSYTSVSFGGSISFAGGNLLNSANENATMPRASFYIGLAQTDMDVSLLFENQSYVFLDKTIELYMQFGASYPLAPLLDAGIFYAMSIGADLTGIGELDLKLDYALHKHLYLTAGYRWFEYNYLLEEQDSSIQVNFRGPFIGLNIPF
jgi:hypothetical protein